MHLIQHFERFPFEVRQPPNRDWCIPASIEAVAKYHMPNSTVTQGQILREFVSKERAGSDRTQTNPRGIEAIFRVFVGRYPIL